MKYLLGGLLAIVGLGILTVLLLITKNVIKKYHLKYGLIYIGIISTCFLAIVISPYFIAGFAENKIPDINHPFAILNIVFIGLSIVMIALEYFAGELFAFVTSKSIKKMETMKETEDKEKPAKNSLKEKKLIASELIHTNIVKKRIYCS